MTSSGPRVVVTGGSGFIGSAVRGAYAREGADVVGLDLRPRTDTAGTVLSADLAVRGSWETRLVGADVVVHAAARVGELGSPEHFRRANVATTRTVLRAAADAGVGCVVHLSSIVVVGPDVPDRFDESQPVRTTGNPYTDSKVASEHLALAAAAAGQRVVVVRPGDVYGPGSPQWTRRPVELIKRRLMALPDGGTGLLDPVYVDDLVAGVQAAARALTDPDPSRGMSGLYLVTGGTTVTVREFFTPYADALHRRLPSVPAGLLRRAAPVEWLAGRLGVELPFSSRTLEYLTRTGGAEIDRARTELAWSPRVDLAEGMSRTLASLHLDR